MKFFIHDDFNGTDPLVLYRLEKAVTINTPVVRSDFSQTVLIKIIYMYAKQSNVSTTTRK